MTDPLVERVLKRMQERSSAGIAHYGETLEAAPDTRDWISETQEELWDAILYLEKLRTHMRQVR